MENKGLSYIPLEDLDESLPEPEDEILTDASINNTDTKLTTVKPKKSKADIVADLILDIMQERLQNTNKPLTMKTVKALKEFAAVRAIILQYR